MSVGVGVAGVVFFVFLFSVVHIRHYTLDSTEQPLDLFQTLLLPQVKDPRALLLTTYEPIKKSPHKRDVILLVRDYTRSSKQILTLRY